LSNSVAERQANSPRELAPDRAAMLPRCAYQNADGCKHCFRRIDLEVVPAVDSFQTLATAEKRTLSAGL